MAITLQTTTLKAPMTAAAQQAYLDGPSVSKGWLVYIDREAMRVLDIVYTSPAYLVVKVIRGVDGTAASSHAIGAGCYVAPGWQFSVVNRTGQATPDSERVLPVVNVLTGDVFNANAGAFVQTGWGGVAQGFP